MREDDEGGKLALDIGDAEVLEGEEQFCLGTNSGALALRDFDEGGNEPSF